MIRFNIRQILKHKVLWLWPGFFILFIIVAAIWGDIQAAANLPFQLTMFDIPVPVWIIVSAALGPIAIIGVIVYPKHYHETLEPDRGALVFSKSTSRTEFFFSSFASILFVSFIFTLFMVVVFAIYAGIGAGIFPILFYVASLILGPFLLFVYYVSVVFFVTITKSRLAGALIGYFILGVTVFLLPTPFLRETYQILFGTVLTSPVLHGVIDVFRYIIPSSAGVQALWKPVLLHGFHTFDWKLFGFIIASCVPFFAASYFLVVRREF